MPEQPIRRRHEFVRGWVLAFQAANLNDLLEDIVSWFRVAGPQAHNDWHRDPLSDEAGKIYDPTGTVTHWYRSNDWGVFLWIQALPYGAQQIPLWLALQPAQVWDTETLELLELDADDVPFFPALSFILEDTVRMWLENDNRGVSAAFTQADAEHWQLDISIAADAGSRWPDEFAVSVNRPFLTQASSNQIGLSFVEDLYIANFRDAEGRTAPVRFHARSLIHALQYANSVAASSAARWVSLRRVRSLSVEQYDGLGDPIPGPFGAAAAPGSSVQVRGRASWSTSSPRDTIRLEVPAVKPAVVSKGARSSSVDILSPAARGGLVSEAGAGAGPFRGVHYLERVRRP